MSDLTNIEVKNQTEQSRYALLFDGTTIGEVVYSLADDQFHALHTIINPAVRGRGLGDILVTAMVEDIRHNTRYTIVPECSFVADWFHRHPQNEDLLRPRQQPEAP
ncbi:GNAT family N-acetyltransferase [Lysinibacter sp. HNR]|uniref:GNAT family N-acetyltransferase n=1 Tax=Lysinibacter sp. HNR TaxID=3031408 RepID=UPI002435BB96|nr:GNAT family N-acetyltransferase [Lysinibacter sp. HNR]WGD37261.1 GNAT family N-acetyltransferase [Lysinibacter sp. HNR]